MNKIKFLIIFLIIILTNGALTMADSTTTYHSQNIIHPSNQYCIDHGGNLVVFDVDHFGGDQFGICRLSDDSIIDVMTFWKQSQTQSIAFTKFSSANWHSYNDLPVDKWAEKNCNDLGGRILLAVPHIKPSVKYQFCEFPDKSIIEVWTLMSGKSYYPQLANAISNQKPNN